MSEYGQDGGRSSRARHYKTVIFGAICSAKTLRSGGGKQDKVTAESKEYSPDPDGKNCTMTKFCEVESGVKKRDDCGDNKHAHLVSKHVTKMAPEHSTETIKNGGKRTNHRKEVIVLDELLTKSFVHRVNVAHGLNVQYKGKPENPKLLRLHH